MSRDVIDALARALEAAYRGDRWHALRGNLGSVPTEIWRTAPAEPSVEVFGTLPELSIADIVEHVGAAKYMYADHAFGPGTMRWGDTRPPTGDIAGTLEWLEAGHRSFVAGVLALADDAELARERPAPSGRMERTARLIEIVINHDLYHAGEINRQRTLIEGASGWSNPD